MIKGSYLWISQYIQWMIYLISGDLSRMRMKMFYANSTWENGCVCPCINLVCPSVYKVYAINIIPLKKKEEGWKYTVVMVSGSSRPKTQEEGSSAVESNAHSFKMIFPCFPKSFVNEFCQEILQTCVYQTFIKWRRAIKISQAVFLTWHFNVEAHKKNDFAYYFFRLSSGWHLWKLINL